MTCFENINCKKNVSSVNKLSEESIDSFELFLKEEEKIANEKLAKYKEDNIKYLDQDKLQKRGLEIQDLKLQLRDINIANKYYLKFMNNHKVISEKEKVENISLINNSNINIIKNNDNLIKSFAKIFTIISFGSQIYSKIPNTKANRKKYYLLNLYNNSTINDKLDAIIYNNNYTKNYTLIRNLIKYNHEKSDSTEDFNDIDYIHKYIINNKEKINYVEDRISLDNILNSILN